MERVEEENEEIAQLKKAVRREILAMRDSINDADKEQYDKKIREIVTGMAEYQEAEVILAYVSYKSEVDTILLIEQARADSKVVFVPKVAGHGMEFWKITSLNDLREGYHGIREPVESISFPNWIKEYRISRIADSVGEDTIKNAVEDNIVTNCKVMMWVPGAVFDRARHRIGYGGGFYDRYLNRLAGNTERASRALNHTEQVSFITAALAYSCQVLEKIPYEKHDRKPDLIITEQGIYC